MNTKLTEPLEPHDYPVELEPVDITPYRKGNTDVDYVWTLESGKPGPHVMISAIVHGNELCGAIALDFLFQNDIYPACGRLTLAFVNYKAFQSFDPTSPTTSRFIDEDFNRLWTMEVLLNSRKSFELQRARELSKFVEEADFLLDIHSMQHKTPALLICGPHRKGQVFSQKLLTPQYIVSDRGHDNGGRMRDFKEFGDPNSPKKSLLIECGQHWELKSADIAIDSALRFLRLFDMIDSDFCKYKYLPLPKKQIMIEVSEPVTIKTNSFVFAESFVGFELFKEKGSVIGWDGEEAILTPYENCILIMPSSRLAKGQTAVRLGKVII